MEQLYDIYFAAQLVEGFDEATVRGNLGTLFKAKQDTLDKLFSGKPQPIKKGLDKSTAIKYKAAMQKAGAVALVKAHAAAKATPVAAPAEEEALPSSTAIPASSPAAAAPEPAAAPTTMAERIAAMTAASEAAEDAADDALEAQQQADHDAAAEGDISLAPAGSDVLREDERPLIEELDIDTSAIHLQPDFAEPQALTGEPAPPAPDTSHLSMGEVGEDIPHLEPDVTPLNPDTSALSMAAVGEDIPNLEVHRELLDPDVSGISLAPEGSDVLEPEYRRKDTAKAPNTDHLTLEDAPGQS